MNGIYKLERYSKKNYQDVLAAIGEDPNWEFIINSESKRQIYADRLDKSDTYVCYSGEIFCGYVRAIIDDGMALYISELFVIPEHRNRNVGHSLIEKVKEENPSITVYALSDEDLYYEKKGYKNIGSVFEI